MNILFISHESDLNGASKSMINIIDELKHKHTFYVVLRYRKGEVYDALVSRNIKVYSVKYISWIQEKKIGKTLKSNWYLKFFIYFSFSQFYNQIAAKILFKKVFSENHIDLIHSNTSVIDLGGRLKKLSDIPHIWHIREMGKEDFNLYPYIGWKKAYNYIEKSANKIICVSDAVKNKIARYTKSDKCTRIYNGVGKENICLKHKFNDFSNRIVLLISGRIEKAKRQDIAIRAIQELHLRGYSQVELLVAGRGRIEDLGLHYDELGDYIKILGQVNNLNEIRKGVDIELVCSKCEAFGRVTIEAMLGGIPVVGSNTGGTSELIQDNINGLLFECDNYIDLANKLEGLIQQPDQIRNMGKKALDFAMKNYLIETCATQINQIYEEIYDTHMQKDIKRNNIIVHFITDDKFTAGYINFMKKCMSEWSHYFIVPRNNFIADIPEQNDICYLKHFTDVIVKKEIRKILYFAKKIIVSGVWGYGKMSLILPTSLTRKMYLQFWGGDFYNFRECSTLIDKACKVFIYRFIKKCAGVIMLIENDYNEFNKIFPCNKHYFIAAMPSDPENRIDYAKYASGTENDYAEDKIRILLGNSATPENQHREALAILKKFADKNIEILCPLSYGIERYRDEIIAYGKDLFQEKFIPLTEFMAEKDYIQLLSTCKIGIFNNNRQQALGNIYILLMLEKKIYIRSDNAMWGHFANKGIQLNSIERLENEDFQSFLKCDKKICENNHKINEATSNETCWAEQWRNVFND